MTPGTEPPHKEDSTNNELGQEKGRKKRQKLPAASIGETSYHSTFTVYQMIHASKFHAEYCRILLANLNQTESIVPVFLEEIS